MPLDAVMTWTGILSLNARGNFDLVRAGSIILAYVLTVPRRSACGFKRVNKENNAVFCFGDIVGRVS